MAPSASLVLPAPMKEAGMSGPSASSRAAKVEEVDEVTEQSMSAASRYTTGGLIYPPPELRALVDKTADFVARNGTQFESKIKEDGTGRNKLSFLNETDPYHAYYRAKIEAVMSGQGHLAGLQTSNQDAALGSLGAELSGEGAGREGALNKKEEENRPAEPDSFKFSTDLPSITAVDLDILKLTALFTARKGRAFASALSTREGRSYQFEFLRPAHSLFGFFNRMVEQYQLILEPTEEVKQSIRLGAFGAVDDGRVGQEPSLGHGRGGPRLKVLEQIRERSDWQRWDKAKRKQVEEEEEKEKEAYNEIDWQDFVVAGTVELTETDAHVDLPPPISLREVENMSMAQKRMAAMISEVEGDENDDTTLMRTKGVEGKTALAKNGDEGDDDVEMEMEDSDDESAFTAQPIAANANGPMKIRKDYKPKTLAERKAAAASQSTICPVCKTSVPLDEMDEHVKYELLNPHYREQRRDLESKKAQHNILSQGADPSRYLKQFAGRRTDIFGSAAEEEAQKRKEEEESKERKERERLVWDGHAASQVDTSNAFNRPDQLQEEMQHIQKKFKTDQEKIYIGPQMGDAGGPSGPPAPPVALVAPDMPQKIPSLPIVNAMAAGAVSYSAQPSAPHMSPPPPIHPMNQAPLGGYPAYQPPGQFALEKMNDGKLYPEDQWRQYHPEPINIRIRLPEAPTISENCNGTQITFESLPPSTTIGSIRDRLHSETLKGSVGANRLKLRIDNKAATLKQTLAHWNLISGDVITLQVN
ncbi:hypothetical protein CBS101457_004311 [Exobasidium rhododendri]|nr:hypothetical protein CBS101457_004311 [Exobasidium rhododendri]